MQRTIIAVFDNRGDAQSAFDALESAGFTRAQIRLSADDQASRATSTDVDTDAGTAPGLLDSIKHFLASMFGGEDSAHVQKYSDAVTSGHHVLTLSAADEADIERATDLIERWGPVDIDERATQWSGGPLASDAMRSGAGLPQGSAWLSQQGPKGVPGSSPGSMQGSTQQGSQQRAGTGMGDYLAEPPINSVESFEMQEIYFRNHYNSNYAGGDERYDDYAPAYQYGASMANSEPYHGKAWRDVEPQLRNEWEDRNPGSAWSKFKAAVRHGWERIGHG
jgi:hypothetical protein